MIYFWENYLAGSHYASWYPTVFIKTTSLAITYQEYGLLHFQQNLDIIQWANYGEAFALGAFKGIITETTAVAAVAPIIRERAIGRFVFSRVFGRVN